MTDIVITYVNGLDSEWLADYAKYTDIPVMTKRFRDWGTLPYLLRGIERNMPFVRKVFLVVSQPSQVPEWLNKDTVQVVYHKDFVPAEFLPTFNCNPLEMYLHRIPGLAENYLYFNDDMFPMLPCEESDFFRDGKIVIHFRKHILRGNMYKQICYNSSTLARKAAGLGASPVFIRPQHICSPMLKSCCESLCESLNKEIEASISLLRQGNNYNQYLYLDYMYYRGLVIDDKLSNKHFSVAAASQKKVADYLLAPKRKLCCINDVHLSEAHYQGMREAILAAFAQTFPMKSKYEL
ncbi:MAG: hypothetical protein ACI3ZK_05305 [Candidatus Cryptobacteroides sp.]